MKKIITFIRYFIVFFIKTISKQFHFTSYTFSWGTIAKRENYFLELGPRFLIIDKNREVRYLGHAFTFEVIYDENGKCISCKPTFLTVKKDETCLWGKSANIEYQKIKYSF